MASRRKDQARLSTEAHRSRSSRSSGGQQQQRQRRVRKAAYFWDHSHSSADTMSASSCNEGWYSGGSQAEIAVLVRYASNTHCPFIPALGEESEMVSAVERPIPDAQAQAALFSAWRMCR